MRPLFFSLASLPVSLLVSLLVASVSPQGGSASRPSSGPRRSLETTITYAFSIEGLPEGASEVWAWIPLPVSNAFQEISSLKVEPPGSQRKDPVYGNTLHYVEWKKPFSAPLKGSVTFDIRRKEEVAHAEPVTAPLRKRYLEPDRLGVVNDEVRAMAAKATMGKSGTMTKGRALYDFVLSHMAYGKELPGWGKGDTLRACATPQGNCSDFHALFISLARASEIPARFHYGFSLKPDGTAGPHCWAEFLDSDAGWVPVDISEADKVADKDPEKAAYYFGTLSEDRVLLTTGRDLVLDPPQKGEPLNFLYAPYVEVDGKPHPAKLEVKHKPKG
jgi:transglutaminase-like putative cysteine protease